MIRVPKIPSLPTWKYPVPIQEIADFPSYLIFIAVTLVLLACFCMSFSSNAPYLPATAPSKSQPPIISLDYATYKGESLINGVDQYLGMRFAKAPIGDLRFRAPQDPEQSREVQDATKVYCFSL